MERVAYNPPQSLWKLIEEYISPHETQEIRNMLGDSLIEQSLDLHREVETLLDIWQALREESEEQTKITKILPEPPELRDRLIQEILFFIEGVKEKAEYNGLDPKKIISKHNPEVINYALNKSSVNSPRPQTARSKSGRETPLVSANYRLNNDVEVAQEVCSVNDKLNYLQFDEVVISLRTHLEKEVEQLLKDITFLQECIDNEASFKDGCGPSISTEPTLTELREERSLLEKELFPPVKAIPMKSRVPAAAGGIGVTSGPLKASHSLVSGVMNQKDISLTKINLKAPSGVSPARMKVVQVGNVFERNGEPSHTNLTPSPPNTARSVTPNRPSSAARFRRMVLECRQGD